MDSGDDRRRNVEADWQHLGVAVNRDGHDQIDMAWPFEPRPAQPIDAVRACRGRRPVRRLNLHGRAIDRLVGREAIDVEHKVAALHDGNEFEHVGCGFTPRRDVGGRRSGLRSVIVPVV